MSLTETSLISLTKRQYLYKLKAHLGLFNGLAAVQLIVLFLSFGRVGMMGTSGDGISFEIGRYSNDGILIFTMLWVLVISILCSTKGFRDADFTFPSNRLSSNLSNIGFLLTASVSAGVTASLYSVMIRLIIFFTQGSQNIIGENFFMVPQEFLLGVTSAILYMILFSAIGYLLGILTESNKLFIPLLPAVFIGALFFLRINGGQTTILENLFVFFAHEDNLFLFALKITATVIILFASSVLISNRTEVRQ